MFHFLKQVCCIAAYETSETIWPTVLVARVRLVAPLAILVPVEVVAEVVPHLQQVVQEDLQTVVEQAVVRCPLQPIVIHSVVGAIDSITVRVDGFRVLVRKPGGTKKRLVRTSY